MGDGRGEGDTLSLKPPHPDPLPPGEREFKLHRRTLLKVAGLGGAAWLTSVAHALAKQAEESRAREPAQSLIVLWLAGGPSQLETFDPHPGKKISGETRAIHTALAGVQLAEGLERVADQLESISLIRSLVSKEGDHQRGTYLVKTGYRPDPTAVHPSIGAICCHELPVGGTEIPRHISILPNQWPGRGGFLGDQFDAFKAGDPTRRLADVMPRVSDPRFQDRLADLEILENSFARGRQRAVEATLHRATVREARRMMTSEQLQAFDTSQESAMLRKAYGETPFGRGCLAARRLVEVGVRCVEVTLEGWDSHVNNFEIHGRLKNTLDPALAALVTDLKEHDLWDRTIVLVAGEFGRTPTINRLAGRDHWTQGFSMALSGGRLRGGQVIGETDPEGGREVKDPRQIGDVHATILAALGIDPAKELTSPAGRPLKLADGEPIAQLLT
ncbi:MAG: DUF1501 domain-containing protein [Planctomycetia bacterium]|nr:DUF1501 domain-containing protein [Planctomycetia bacterium]